MALSGKLERVAAAEEEEARLVEDTAVLDFDVLCSTVALQTQGKWAKLSGNLGDSGGDDQDGDYGGGVFRMWEGEVVLDCLDDRRVALESLCCPCYRFGKNMRRAGFSSCLQGTLYFFLAIGAFANLIAFAVTKRRCYLYIGLAFLLSIGAYLGFFRVQMKRKFNIRGNERFLDDCLYHLICPCCTLSQESRTLEMNNVQDGIWHGRGDTICIGSFSDGSKAFDDLHPPPVVSTKSAESCNVPAKTSILNPVEVNQ